MGLQNQGNISRSNFGQDIVLRGGIYVAPSTAQNFFVGPIQSNDKGDLRSRSFATIDAALNACIDDRGDVIRVRPGYTENISATGWANGKRGVRIEGMGNGTNRPALTWNVAGSTLTGLKANMQLDNLILNLCPAAGSVTVTAAIVLNAAGIVISNCFIKVADSAARLTTTAINWTAGADDNKFVGNEVWGIIAGTPTNALLVSAAVNRLIVANCKCDVAVSATTVGVLSFTAAALGVYIVNNSFEQLLASSTVALNGFAGVGGVCAFNSLGIQNATGGATALTVPGNMKLIENYGAVPGKNGLLAGIAGA
jgi:hypothetical protein